MRWYDYIFIFLAILVIIAYIIFASGVYIKDLHNTLSNSLAAVINILATVFFAYRISFFTAQNHQKKIAKTSIRRIRDYLKSLYNLEVVIEEKIKDVEKNKLFKQYLMEFRNHIVNIKNSVLSSEYDFKDIVGAEFKEEHSLVAQMGNDIIELKNKYDKLKQQESKDDSVPEEVNQLKEEIDSIRRDINQNRDKLPLGEPFAFVPSTNPSGVTATPFFSGERLKLKSVPIKFTDTAVSSGIYPDVSAAPLNINDDGETL